ncbi:X-domain of DnaJ-containing-domain-containing protein [Multifurca ochricompacta]|uniref:X-domain of DnaJ-containing-domain-containing protein n=1 Tax=Multifurca ochricompacta TaxID=376703 RepID=A0AAD4M3V7_9AGAM|nr:X-domain of DnaJ-containing-domain-containing protein [Multifurca ochricompacta]
MMSSTYPIIDSRPVHPHIQTTCSTCHFQLEFPLPSPAPKPATMLTVRCCNCRQTFSHTFYPNQVPTSMLNSVGSSSQGQAPTPPPRKGRKIGTQERPLETGYYELLGVPVDATTDDIKKAYRRLAIKYHPDKNRDDPNAEERFKAIAIAYQTLSDPQLRHKYNEFGSKESAPEGGFIDPEEVFGAIFGGERFLPLIGQLSLARDMKTALQEADEADSEGTAVVARDAKGREILSPEEKAKREEKARKVAAEKAAAREERVQKLVENLQHKLGIFTENATGPNDPEVIQSWGTISSLEAECGIKGESYGVELLHAIGFVYTAKAKQFLATSQSFLGVGGWLHNVQGKYHVFSETVSTLRSAIELKAVFDQIQQAEQSGTLSPEEKKRLEEQAAEKGLHALFKVRSSPLPSPFFHFHTRRWGTPSLIARFRVRSLRSTRSFGRRAIGC